MGRAADPRPGRTRAAILDAVEAIGTRGDDVTVPAIVAEAGIGRSTFYAQYRDLDALAVAILSDAFREIEELDLELRRTRSASATANETTTRLVDAFARRRQLYAAVLGSRTTTEAHRAVQHAFAEQALGTMLETAPPHVDPRAAADYVAGGSLAVLTAWLLSDDPADPEHVQQQLLALLPPWLINDESDRTP